MKTIINICCLIIFINQCGFSCKDYCNYINNDDNVAKIVSNDIQRNVNILDLHENYKIILINTKDIKKCNHNLVNKVIISNGRILSNEKLIPGDHYKVILKKLNHKKIFEKLIDNNRQKQNLTNIEDKDVLASFRLNQMIKSFEDSNNSEEKGNIKDWREEYWVDVKSSKLDTIENNVIGKIVSSDSCNEQSTLSNSLKSKHEVYENVQVFDESIQIKIDKLNKLHKEFAIQNKCMF